MTPPRLPAGNKAPRIFTIRGHRVMLDSDLATLYGVKAIRLREQVRRNLGRFPHDFMFKLTPKEAGDLVSQFAIPSRSSFGGSLPMVFTQEGIAMLSSVLRSSRAVRANIAIMRAFIRSKRREHQRPEALRRLDELERKYLGHDRDIARLFESLRDLMEPEEAPKKLIGFRAP